MSILDLKFKDSDFVNMDIESLPDRPSDQGMSALELKKRFDQIPKIMLAMGRFNSLVEALANNGAESIGIADTLSALRSDIQSVIDNENARQSAEASRVSNEALRIHAENDRVENEKARAEAEQNRQFSENTRVHNANLMASAYTSFIEAEQERERKEDKRIKDEKDRVSAESDRNTAESIRLLAEEGRGNNEQTRQSAESERVSNESARKSMENARILEEQARVNVENERRQAETIRVNSEKERVQSYSNFKFVGDFNNGVEYKRFNLIKSAGALYLCIKDNQNIELSNAEYFVLVGSSSGGGVSSAEIEAIVNPKILEVKNDFNTLTENVKQDMRAIGGVVAELRDNTLPQYAKKSEVEEKLAISTLQEILDITSGFMVAELGLDDPRGYTSDYKEILAYAMYSINRRLPNDSDISKFKALIDRIDEVNQDIRKQIPPQMAPQMGSDLFDLMKILFAMNFTLDNYQYFKESIVNLLMNSYSHLPLSGDPADMINDVLKTKLNKIDIINDLTSGGADKVLSAEQGKVLFQSVDSGKEKLANAIIGKGISNVSKSDTFEVLAQRIGEISGDGSPLNPDVIKTLWGQSLWIDDDQPDFKGSPAITTIVHSYRMSNADYGTTGKTENIAVEFDLPSGLHYISGINGTCNSVLNSIAYIGTESFNGFVSTIGRKDTRSPLGVFVYVPKSSVKYKFKCNFTLNMARGYGAFNYNFTFKTVNRNPLD